MISRNDLEAVNVLFNIEALDDPMYGEVAYRKIFEMLGDTSLSEIAFFSGDTMATLEGEESIYCVSLVGPKDAAAKIAGKIETTLPIVAVSTGLDFIEEQPLVFAGCVNQHGQVSGADDGSFLWYMFPEQARAKFGQWG